MTINSKTLIAALFATMSAFGAVTASADEQGGIEGCYGGLVEINGQCQLPG